MTTPAKTAARYSVVIRLEDGLFAGATLHAPDGTEVKSFSVAVWQSFDGEPNEEWTIEKYKVNPQIKADTWEKK